MKLTEFMNERYKNRKDKDNIYGVGVSDAEFRVFIIDYLLGGDWYVADPLGQTQINEIALYKILEKHSKRYRKELPSVTSQPKTGHWILADEQNKEDIENDNYRFICSECQCSDVHAKGTKVPYCWKCGAKMAESGV